MLSISITVPPTVRHHHPGCNRPTLRPSPSVCLLLLLLLGALLSGCPQPRTAANTSGAQLRQLTRSAPTASPPPQVAAVEREPTPLPPVQTLPPEPADQPQHHARTLVRPAPVPELDYRALLDPNRVIAGTMSLGTTSTGSLQAGASLPIEGTHHRVMESCRERQTNYGTEALVKLIQHGGAEVARQLPASPPLVVCNMSYEGGGDISWSRSHNSGRDADLAFFVLKNGVPTPAPALMAFNANLTSSEGFTFDVARNWALARALLTHPTIQVQWLFISNPLKEALLEHARAQQEPEQLLARAREVLWQPTDSSPHNDHFHLRVYCSQKERLEGCLNTGPTWSWIDTYDTAVEARIQALLKGLDDPEPTVRQEVINVMIRVHLPGAAVALAKRALFDPAPTVRLTALRALSLWRASDTEVIAALERAIRVPGGGTLGSDDDFEIALPADLPLGPHEAERDPERDRHRTAQVVERLYSTLATIASPKSLPLMRDAMGSTRRVGSDPDSAIPEAQLAAQATAHIMELGLVEPLIALLDHEDGATRQAAATTLRRITNHTFKTRWERGMSSKRLRKRQAKWRRWWRDQRGKNRDALLLAGFKEASRRLRKAKTLESWTVVDRLVRLTKRDDHVGYNADRLLCRLLGRWSPRDADAEDKHKRWSKWWRKNKKRLKDRWG